MFNADQVIKVGLLDSGINKSSLEKAKIIDIKLSDDFESSDDLLGHGTTCATIIQSMAPRTMIYNIKVFDKTLITSPGKVIEGIEWCINNNIDIINLSLAVTEMNYYYEFKDICDKAAKKNIYIIAAGDTLGEPCLPAYLGNVFGVSAAYFNSDFDFFFDHSKQIQFHAKGDKQKVAGGFTQGTSIATAHVTAIVATLLQKDKNISVDKLCESLKENALPFNQDATLIRNKDFDFKSNTKEIFIENKDRELVSQIRKALIFPFNSEMQLLKENNDHLDFEIVDCIKIDNSNFLNNIENLQLGGIDLNNIEIPPQLYESLKNADTLVLGRINFDNKIFQDLILDTLKNGKNILSLLPIPKLQEKKFMESLSPFLNKKDSPWIKYPTINFDLLKEQLISIPEAHIAKSNIPVIALVHLGRLNSCKFNVELQLRDLLIKAGYNLGQIGSEPFSTLFGMDYYYNTDFFQNSLPLELHAVYAKALIESLNNNDRGLDLIVTSNQYGIVPQSLISDNYFDTYTLSSTSFLFGVQPDIIILVVNENDDLEFIANNFDCLQKMLNAEIIMIIWNGLFEYFDTGIKGNKFLDSILSHKAECQKKRITQLHSAMDKYCKNILNIHESSDKKKITSLIDEYLM